MIRLEQLPFSCERERLSPLLAEVFVALPPDEAGAAFIAQAMESPHGALHDGAFKILRRFMTDYDAYGLLNMYRMHLLSAPQWQRLLPSRLFAHRQMRFLDVGAGRGDATAALVPLLGNGAEFHATEPSRPLARRLRARGARVHRLDFCHSPWPDALRFELITCLNVLDRVSHPWTMLRHLCACLADGGVLVLSLPMPLRPHVDRGAHTVDQEEPLPVAAESGFEVQVNGLWQALLRPLGLRVLQLARVPYLSQGDSQRPVHALDDVLFVCEPRPFAT